MCRSQEEQMIYDISKIVGDSGEVQNYFVTDKDGFKISLTFAIPYKPTDKVVIVMPGTGANKEDSSKNLMALGFIKNKIAVLVFDAYGHGQSEGKLSDLTTTKIVSGLEAVLEHLKSKGFKKIGLCASSWPALGAAIVAGKNPGIINLLVLQTMIFDNKDYAIMTHGENGLSLWKSQGYLFFDSTSYGKTKMGYGLYADSLQYNNRKYFERIRSKTLAIVTGKDQYLYPAKLREVYHLIPECEIADFPEKDHLFHLKPESKPKLFEMISRFIISNLK